MTLQMLVQLPLLAVAGWFMAQAVPAKIDRMLARWDRSGISGLLLATFTGMVWMLPRAMDGSLDDPRLAVAKFLSIPLLIGVPLALSWPRMGFVVRGVLLTEFIATTFRLGWLYLASPVRVCSNYLINDQQVLGQSLVVIGVALILFLIWKMIGGHIQVDRQ